MPPPTNSSVPHHDKASASKALPSRPHSRLSRKAALWDRLLNEAETRHSETSGYVDDDITFAPRNVGDAHLRRSFEDALINEGLSVTADFSLPIELPGRRGKSKSKRGRALCHAPYSQTHVPERLSSISLSSDSDNDDNDALEIPRQTTHSRPSPELPASDLPPSDLPFIKRKARQPRQTSQTDRPLSVRERLLIDQQSTKSSALPVSCRVFSSHVAGCQQPPGATPPTHPASLISAEFRSVATAVTLPQSNKHEDPRIKCNKSRKPIPPIPESFRNNFSSPTPKTKNIDPIVIDVDALTDSSPEIEEIIVDGSECDGQRNTAVEPISGRRVHNDDEHTGICQQSEISGHVKRNRVRRVRKSCHSPNVEDKTDPSTFVLLRAKKARQKYLADENLRPKRKLSSSSYSNLYSIPPAQPILKHNLKRHTKTGQIVNSGDYKKTSIQASEVDIDSVVKSPIPEEFAMNDKKKMVAANIELSHLVEFHANGERYTLNGSRLKNSAKHGGTKAQCAPYPNPCIGVEKEPLRKRSSQKSGIYIVLDEDVSNPQRPKLSPGKMITPLRDNDTSGALTPPRYKSTSSSSPLKLSKEKVLVDGLIARKGIARTKVATESLGSGSSAITALEINRGSLGRTMSTQLAACSNSTAEVPTPVWLPAVPDAHNQKVRLLRKDHHDFQNASAHGSMDSGKSEPAPLFSEARRNSNPLQVGSTNDRLRNGRNGSISQPGLEDDNPNSVVLTGLRPESSDNAKNPKYHLEQFNEETVSNNPGYKVVSPVVLQTTKNMSLAPDGLDSTRRCWDDLTVGRWRMPVTMGILPCNPIMPEAAYDLFPYPKDFPRGPLSPISPKYPSSVCGRVVDNHLTTNSAPNIIRNHASPRITAGAFNDCPTWTPGDNDTRNFLSNLDGSVLSGERLAERKCINKAGTAGFNLFTTDDADARLQSKPPKDGTNSTMSHPCISKPSRSGGGSGISSDTQVYDNDCASVETIEVSPETKSAVGAMKNDNYDPPDGKNRLGFKKDQVQQQDCSPGASMSLKGSSKQGSFQRNIISGKKSFSELLNPSKTMGVRTIIGKGKRYPTLTPATPLQLSTPRHHHVPTQALSTASVPVQFATCQSRINHVEKYSQSISAAKRRIPAMRSFPKMTAGYFGLWKEPSFDVSTNHASKDTGEAISLACSKRKDHEINVGELKTISNTRSCKTTKPLLVGNELHTSDVLELSSNSNTRLETCNLTTNISSHIEKGHRSANEHSHGAVREKARDDVERADFDFDQAAKRVSTKVMDKRGSGIGVKGGDTDDHDESTSDIVAAPQPGVSLNEIMQKGKHDTRDFGSKNIPGEDVPIEKASLTSHVSNMDLLLHEAWHSTGRLVVPHFPLASERSVQEVKKGSKRDRDGTVKWALNGRGCSIKVKQGVSQLPCVSTDEVQRNDDVGGAVESCSPPKEGGGTPSRLAKSGNCNVRCSSDLEKVDYYEQREAERMERKLLDTYDGYDHVGPFVKNSNGESSDATCSGTDEAMSREASCRARGKIDALSSVSLRLRRKPY